MCEKDSASDVWKGRGVRCICDIWWMVRTSDRSKSSGRGTCPLKRRWSESAAKGPVPWTWARTSRWYDTITLMDSANVWQSCRKSVHQRWGGRNVSIAAKSGKIRAWAIR
eukprot:262727-Chlamydomonas_euryale.AAC.1